MTQEITAAVFVARTNTTLDAWGLQADDVLDIDEDGSVVVNDWLVAPKNKGAEQPRTFRLSHRTMRDLGIDSE